MNIKYRQSQFELFNKNAPSAQQSNQPRVLVANVDLTLENLVIFLIVSIIVLLFTFTMGIDRGKRIAKNSLMSEQIEENSKLAQTTQTAVALKEQEPVLVSAKMDVAKAVESVVTPIEDSVEPQPVSSKGNYTIQVASFKERSFAVKEADVLREKGYSDVFVIKKGTYSIVCVGRFADSAGAKRFAGKLKNRYSDYLVRRL